MRYWDPSALLPLLVSDSATCLVRGWLDEDPDMITAAHTRLELRAAIELRSHQRLLSRPLRRRLLNQLEHLCASCDEVTAYAQLTRRSVSLLARHSLLPTEAMHLGAALLASDGDPASLTIVSLHHAITLAAEQEGFAVLTWPEPGQAAPPPQHPATPA